MFFLFIYFGLEQYSDISLTDHCSLRKMTSKGLLGVMLVVITLTVFTVYKIWCEMESAIKTYDRILDCLNKEWGYSVDDKPYVDAEREKSYI